MARMALTLLGVIAALVWAAVFVEAPGAALEVLLLLSPVVVTIWLILMLTAPRRSRRAVAQHGQDGPPPPDAGTVLRRDRGVCSVCGTTGARTVVARRPARRDDADPLARFASLCDACASTTALPVRGLRAES